MKIARLGGLAFALLFSLIAVQPAVAFLPPMKINDCSGVRGMERVRACAGLIESNRFDALSFLERAAIYDERGQGYIDIGRFVLAISDFDAAIALGPGYAQAFADRCKARLSWGQALYLALADCRRALEIKPDDADTLILRGAAHFRLGDFAAAIEDGTAALALNPHLAPALYVRGLSKLKTGDTLGGNVDIRSALALDPKVSETYKAYGIGP